MSLLFLGGNARGASFLGLIVVVVVALAVGVAK